MGMEAEISCSGGGSEVASAFVKHKSSSPRHNQFCDLLAESLCLTCLLNEVSMTELYTNIS